MRREPLIDYFPDVRRDAELREMIENIDRLFDEVTAGAPGTSLAQAVEALKDAQARFIQALFRRARAERSAFEVLLADDARRDAATSDPNEAAKSPLAEDIDDYIVDLDVSGGDADDYASDEDDDLVELSCARGTHLDDVKEVAQDFDLMVLAPRNSSVSHVSRLMNAFGFRSITVVPQSVWAYTHKLRVPLSKLAREAVVIYTPEAPTRSIAMIESKASSRHTKPILVVRCEELSTESVATDLRIALGLVSSPVVQRQPDVIAAIQGSTAWKPRAFELAGQLARTKVRSVK